MADSQELFECSICLQLLKDPVTTACGHSYCMTCINSHWNTRARRGYSCPLCRQTFKNRPALKRNTLLAAVLEEHRRNISKSAAAEAGDPYAEAGDAQCDTCTGRKRKASKFCLVCSAFYCETHLKPHFEVPPLKKHKLTEATRAKDSICGLHDKYLEMYCNTDQRLICLQCLADGHKNHDAVRVEAKKCEMLMQLDWTKQEIADLLLNLGGRKEELTKAADSIKDAAQEACDFERLCAAHIRYVQMKCFELREEVGKAEKAGMNQINSCLEKLERENHKLRKEEDNLNQLKLMVDQPIQFLEGVQALGDLCEFTASYESVDTMSGFVNAQTEKVKNMLKSAENEILSHFRTTENFKVEVDPNTVAACLCLSDTNNELSFGCQDQAHPDHPERFTFFQQALCKNGLNGNHYWEVEWDGGVVDLAVSYKGIERKGTGKDCCFGHNSLSWKLTCSSSGCTFWHNNIHQSQIPPVCSRKVGIHLDYEAGSLSFYSVSDNDQLSLLHKVQTTFTEPLYPGFSVDLGATIKICNV